LCRIEALLRVEMVAVYRLNAANCAEMAKEFSKLEDKIAVLDMAEAWLRPADLTEELGEALQNGSRARSTRC
jgi:hypothetical protein